MSLSEAFSTFKNSLELDDSYQRIIEQRHAAIRAVVEADIQNARTQLIGSLQRRTRIDPISGLTDFDIDILVELGSFDRWVDDGGINCQNALDSVEASVRSNLRYRKMSVQEDSPAIIIPYSDDSYVELIPAYRDTFPEHAPRGRAFYVPKANRWKLADYNFDCEHITNVNGITNGLLVPCIKMLKAWNRNYSFILKSYHLEVLAAQIIPDVMIRLLRLEIPLTWPNLISYFFIFAESRILNPVSIPGSLSGVADEYLLPANRTYISGLFNTCSSLALESLADTAQSISNWRLIFGDPFPTR